MLGLHLKSACCAALIVAVSAQGAAAATVEVGGTDQDGVALISLSGRMEVDDAERFKQLAKRVSRAVVSFQSEGGSLINGIEIGTVIRQRSFKTVVPAGGRCSSSCALAWLGGTERYMGPGAQVGVHAAYKLEDGKAVEIAAGNALLGAYLNRLGLPDRAVFYIASAPAEEMRWLTRAEAEEQGIEIHEGYIDLTAYLSKPPAALQSSPVPFAPAIVGLPSPQPQNAVQRANIISRMRAISYEEDASNLQTAKATAGEVVWSKDEFVEPGTGKLVAGVRASVEIPDARLTLSIVIRRNLDPASPASHTIELAFAGRRTIRDVGKLQFKTDAVSRGSPLEGMQLWARENLFVIGLPNVPSALHRNRSLMRLTWLDLPIRSAAGHRAVLSIEKPAGDLETSP